MADYIKEINKIKFDIYSEEENKKRSIDNFSTNDNININDEIFGSLSKETICSTCNLNNIDCTGHFGLVQFDKKVLNPLFKKSCINILKIICPLCSNFLINFDNFNFVKNYDLFYDLINNYGEKIKKCPKCDSIIKPIKSLDDFFKKIEDQDLKIGENKYDFLYGVLKNIPLNIIKQLDIAHPKNYILSNFSIIPPCCRIPQELDGKKIDVDLTLLSNEIIRASKKKTVDEIENKIAMFQGIKNSKIPCGGNKTIEGIKCKISRKEGLIRNNLLGKRVNFSCRTVIGPNPYIKTTEIGFPKKLAESLTTTERIFKYNLEKIRFLFSQGKIVSFMKEDKLFFINKIKVSIGDFVKIKSGEIIEVKSDRILIFDEILIKNGKEIKYNFDLCYNDVVNRQLLDGDVILLNRQPTLHKPSMMAFKIKIIESKNIQLPLSVTQAYNADFDGDETTSCIPQNYDVKSELESLSTPESCLLSFKNGSPNLTIVQDTLLGVYNMCCSDYNLSREQFLHICNVIQDKNVMTLALNERKKVFEGADVLKYCFPKHFNYKSNEFSIHNNLITGYINKQNVKKIIKIIATEYSNKIAIEFIDNLQFVAREWNLIHTFSIGLSDCILKTNVKKNYDNIKFIDYTTNNQYEEKKINKILSNIRDDAMFQSKNIMIASNNKFVNTINSGSKGDFVNSTQVTSMLGQQIVNGGRIFDCLNDKRIFPHSLKNSSKMTNLDNLRNRGFVTSSFISGLTPLEFFSHAMSGRQGVVDSATTTSKTGYRMRRISRVNENLISHFDYSIRDNQKKIYSFHYGDLGYDPSKLIQTKYGKQIFDILRFYKNFNFNGEKKVLNDDILDDILSFLSDMKTTTIPTIIFNNIIERRKENLKLQFEHVKFVTDDFIKSIKNILTEKFYNCLITPGESVGLIAAQCLGESSTQATLNNFHSAGLEITKNVSSSSHRMEDLLSLSKKLNYFEIHLIGKNTIENVSNCLINVKIKNMLLSYNYYKNTSIVINLLEQKTEWFKFFLLSFKCPIDLNNICMRMVLDKNILLKYKFQNLKNIITILRNLFVEIDNDIEFIWSPLTCENVEIYILNLKQEYFTSIEKILDYNYFGTEGIYNIEQEKEDKFIVYNNCPKTNIQTIIINNELELKRRKKFLDIDYNKISCDSAVEIYNIFGIEAAKKYLIQEIFKTNSDVDISHIKLIVDKITYNGKLDSVSRYGLKNTNPIHRASFEDNLESFVRAAQYKEEDDLQNSSSIIFGKIPKTGTYFTDILYNHKKNIQTIAEENIATEKEESEYEEDNEDNYW